MVAFAPMVAGGEATAGVLMHEMPFEVEIGSSGQVFCIPVERSIASVLLDAGVDVPLSCEMGICGACLTPVTAGEPDHRDSVLTKDQQAEGKRMMICCSGSKSGKLVIDL